MTYEPLQKRLPAFVQIFCIGGLKRFPEERIAWQEADFLETSQECGLRRSRPCLKLPAPRGFLRRICTDAGLVTCTGRTRAGRQR